MRIAVVVRRFSERGGIESNVLALVRWLVARGHHVQVVCHRVEGQAANAGAELVRVSAPGVFGEVARLYWFARGAASEVARLAPAVSYTASHAYGVSIARLEGGLVADHREAVGGNLAESAAERIERRKIAEAKLVLTLSARDADRVRARYGIDRVRVVPNGVDLARFRPATAPKNRPYTVGFIGNGFTRKNLDTLLRASAGFRLIVAGDDRQRPRYEAEARRLGVDAQFLGRVDDVRAVFAEIDTLAMPSLYEPFGLVALEAWASGVPVVLSAIAGASELAPHPELIVRDPRDAEELRSALDRARTVDRALCRPAAEARPIEKSFASIEAAMIEAHAK